MLKPKSSNIVEWDGDGRPRVPESQYGVVIVREREVV